MRSIVLGVVMLSACRTPDHSHHHHHHGHHAGKPPADPSRGAHFATTCEPKLQGQFDRGFFYLHNMDYVSARRELEAGGADAPCAMLHWGVAMTYFQPLWPGQPTKDALARGAAAIARAQALAGTGNQRERDFIAAAAAYYARWETTDSAGRLAAWNAGQAKLAAQYPDDVEAQAFWALSRLATVDRKDKTYKEALAVADQLQKLLVARPEHPGLLHYLLHAYDNPAYAKQAVGIARTYESVSPDAAHALHMPSHIHVRLGNWQEVIDWNIKSAAAAAKHPVGGRISRDWLHALDYMTYGYLQQGDDAKAGEGVAKIAPAPGYELNSGPAAYALAATPARYALERRRYAEAAKLRVRAIDYSWDQYPWAEAVTHAARGLGAARTGELAIANAALAELVRLKPLIESAWWQGRVQIEHDVITAWIAYRKGARADAEAMFRSAAERELAAGKDNVEPGHVITAVEELGDFLIETQRPADALAVFTSALAESPHRFNALFGAGRAAELAGRADEAKAFYRQLIDVSSKTSTRPGRAHAQAFLGATP